MKKILLATTRPSKHAAKQRDEDDDDEADEGRDDFDDAEIDDLMQGGDL